MKTLLVKQFARGAFGTRLELSAPPPIRELWDRGLYPFTPPFVYHEGGQYLVSFPILFEAVSAPFYKLLGFRGLYLIPTLSLWALWLAFWRTLRALALPPWATALGLGSLIFATHLTLYAATFWEHTLGALLAYAGLHYFAIRGIRPLGARVAALAGFVCAASYLFRPEGLLLAFLLSAFGLLCASRERSSEPRWFAVGASIALVACVATNLAVYGEPLGLHGRQVVSEGSVLHQLAARGLHIYANLGLHLPLLAFVLMSWLLKIKQERKLDLKAPWGILLPSVAFLAILPFVVPNNGGRQIGPRYTLLVVPAFALLAAVLAAELAQQRKQTWLAAIGVLGLLGGVAGNVFHTRQLSLDYRTRVAPGLALIRNSTASLVIVDQTFVAQELEAAMPEKYFVLASTPRETEQALASAKALGQTHALFASLVMFPLPIFPPGASVTERGTLGTFRFYDLDSSLR